MHRLSKYFIPQRSSVNNTLGIIWLKSLLFVHSLLCLPMWYLVDDRLDDKDSVDIHDNPPIPDNVLKEDDDKVRRPTSSTRRVRSRLLQKHPLSFHKNTANKVIHCRGFHSKTQLFKNLTVSNILQIQFIL